MTRSFCLAATIVGALFASISPAGAVERIGEDVQPAALGEKVGSFTFKDIRFLPRTLDDFGEKQAYVIVFTTLECPLVQRYLPRVKELEEQYRDQDVQFLTINVGANDSILEVAHQGLKLDAKFPFAKDFDGESVARLGVTRTPEAVVLDSEKRLRYRGRIDSQYRLGGVRPTVGREDLKEAIEDVLAGRDVRVPETPVDGCRITFPKIKPPVEKVTYAEHVAHIMQKYCVDCHRENTPAPFSLTTYEEVEGYAEMIAEVVREQRMPPLYSSAEHGEFSNRVELTPEERATVIAWATGDRELGDVAKLPEPRDYPDTEWAIGEPDLVLEIPKPVKLPAHGYVPYKYLFLPHTFKEDTYVQRVEILPGDRRTVHHANLAAIKLGGANFNDAHFITGFVPGGDPMVLDEGVAFKIPKGSVLVLQSHYVTVGEEAEDVTRVGITFAKGTVQKELKHFRVTTGDFAIPPGDMHHEVVASRTLDCNAVGLGTFVHMHLRGKDMTFNAHYPDGTMQTLLVVPNYNFDWQLSYRWHPGAQRFPKGTRIECIAHYDNSAFNPYNPDPEATVKEGQQTYEEMMYGFFFYMDEDEQLNLEIDPATGHVLNRPPSDAERASKD